MQPTKSMFWTNEKLSLIVAWSSLVSISWSNFKVVLAIWFGYLILLGTPGVLVSWVLLVSFQYEISGVVVHQIRDGAQKKRFYLGICPKLWVGGGPKSQTF